MAAMERDHAPVGWPEMARQAARNHGILTAEQMIAAGASRRQVTAWVQAGRLVPSARGAYLVGGAPVTFAARVVAAVLVHGSETWASHRTAAALWGIPGFGEEARIHLLRPVDGSNGRGGAIVHRSTCIPDEHVTMRGGIPVTTPARTVMDLAGTTSVRHLERVVAEAVRRDLCTDRALHIVLARLAGRGRPGTRRLRAVLDGRDPGRPTLSELEDLARAAIVGAGLPEPEWQVDISDEQGWIGRVDGLYRSARIVLELDSHEWHGQRTDTLEDARRDKRLTDAGYLVERRGWTDLTQRPDTVLATLRALLEARTPAA
jgi:hypothetical protein